jgi:multiple sugar transport system substrate-binding protein
MARRGALPGLTRRRFLQLTAGTAAATAVSPRRSAAAGADFDWKKYKGTTIRYLGWNDLWSVNMREKLPEFEDLTGIKVEWEQFPQEQARQKAPTELTAKNEDLDLIYAAPDVDCVRYVKAGWLFSLDEFLSDPKMVPPDWEPKDFAPGLLGTGKILGKRAVIPQQAELMTVMYNKEVFAQKGVKLPTALDDLEAVVAKVHTPPGMAGNVNRGTAQQVTTPWAAYLYNFGGDWLTKDRKPALTTPESIRSIEFFAKLNRLYGPPGTLSLNWPEAATTFAQGRAAIHADSNGRRSMNEDPKQSKVVGKVGYGLFPHGPNGVNKPWIWTAGNAISAYSKKKEAAWYFILWSINKKNQLYTHLKGVTAGRSSVWKAPETAEVRAKYPDWVATTLKTMEISDKGIAPPVVAVAEYRTRVGEVLVKAIQGMTGDALKDEAAKAEKDLATILARTES